MKTKETGILTQKELECMTTLELVEFYKSKKAGADRTIAGLVLLERAEKQTKKVPKTIYQALVWLDCVE